MDLRRDKIREMLEAMRNPEKHARTLHAVCFPLGHDGMHVSLKKIVKREERLGTSTHYKFTVEYDGLVESRQMTEIPSEEEAVELIVWLTGYSVAKSIHES